MLKLSLVCFFIICLGLQPTCAQNSSGRSIVITIDDLPVNSMVDDISHQQEITRNILKALTKFDVPAIGFVNEGKLYEDGKAVKARINLLKEWVEAGMELGNHTFSHPDYHRMDSQRFQNEIIRGEKFTRQLLSEVNDSLHYFRHPYLHTGNTPGKKKKLEELLYRLGYTVAPVTMDNSEWIFARAYEKAFLDNDTLMMDRIGSEYITYMEQKTAYYEQQSSALFSREISQILLLHANLLNGDYLDKLLLMLKERGYRFISISKALLDPAYASPNTYTGNGGISWIHRWAITQGKTGSFFAGEPETPEFVISYSGLAQE